MILLDEIARSAEPWTPLGIAALVVMQAFAMVRAQQTRKNGGTKVRPEDAPDFYIMQREGFASANRKLDDVVVLLKEIRDEVLNSEVREHHRRQ